MKVPERRKGLRSPGVLLKVFPLHPLVVLLSQRTDTKEETELKVLRGCTPDTKKQKFSIE